MGSPEVRVAAALALGTIGGPGVFELLTTRLAEALETDLTLSWYIIDALGMSGDTRAVPLLVEVLKHSDFDAQKSARHALVKFGSVAVPPLIEIALNQDRPGQRLAVSSLGDIGDPRAAIASVTF
ncbi:MAG TPA: HEAT repeat domain-containing protein [Blastocatellia bacterium]|nr:HEAT repeat domain-containing protein [Blastocatellia bacterium]